MDIVTLRHQGLLLLDCISGSKAYGLDTPDSDTDRGVFFLPLDTFLGFGGAGQVSNDTNDEAYTELGRFFELLAKSNPTMIELLNTPADCVLYKHPDFDEIKTEWYLSRKCKDTFAGYAMAQIQKARGLNKKILHPEEFAPKSVLDFCYIATGQGAVPVQEYLAKRGLSQQDCGLAKIPHMNDLYALYQGQGYKGIVQKEQANDVSLSPIEKGKEPIAFLSFNQSAYSIYCRKYKEYRDWVANRNDARYQRTLQHNQNYDAKNMMHTFRLLAMAKEIATEGRVRVRRPDRDELLRIKEGIYTYEELISKAEEKIAGLDELYQKADLPENPNLEALEAALVNLRKKIYRNF